MQTVRTYHSKLIVALIMTFMVLAMIPFTESARALTGQDAISIATAEPVEINWTGATAGQIVKVDPNSDYYPNKFVFYVSGTDNIALTNASKQPLEVTSDYNSYIITLTNSGTEQAVIKVTLEGTEYTITTTQAPTEQPTTTAKNPSYVNGYLTVGQYSSGRMWGSIFTSNQATGTDTKLTNGFSSSGISPGAAGGYVQLEMSEANKIYDTNSNKYGIDFVVYGNAFATNAEAGSVMVSDDGDNWYELAGSRYFNSDTLRNVNISYRLNSTNSTVEYKIWKDGQTTPLKDWTSLKATSGAWWPEYASSGENYGSVSGIDSIFNGSKKVNKAVWSNNNTELTYKNVTLVKDEDNASEYTFGYADVHTNGSSYGQASNPYLAGQSTSGGDGFDLSWAVYPEGHAKANQPVSSTDLPFAKYIRVYTSAGLQFDAANIPSIFVHNAFNETSTEVCGVFTNSLTGGSEPSVGPTITQGQGETVIDAPNGGSVDVIAEDGYLTFTSSASNIFVNGVKISSGDELSFSAGDYVQVITQNGDENPYVTILKIN